jgi:hypothetical protein
MIASVANLVQSFDMVFLHSFDVDFVTRSLGDCQDVLVLEVPSTLTLGIIVIHWYNDSQAMIPNSYPCCLNFSYVSHAREKRSDVEVSVTAFI